VIVSPVQEICVCGHMRCKGTSSTDFW